MRDISYIITSKWGNHRRAYGWSTAVVLTCCCTEGQPLSIIIVKAAVEKILGQQQKERWKAQQQRFSTHWVYFIGSKIICQNISWEWQSRQQARQAAHKNPHNGAAGASCRSTERATTAQALLRRGVLVVVFGGVFRAGRGAERVGIPGTPAQQHTSTTEGPTASANQSQFPTKAHTANNTTAVHTYETTRDAHTPHTGTRAKS